MIMNLSKIFILRIFLYKIIQFENHEQIIYLMKLMKRRSSMKQRIAVKVTTWKKERKTLEPITDMNKPKSWIE